MKNYALLIILISCVLLLPSNLKAEELSKLKDINKDEINCEDNSKGCIISSDKLYEEYQKIDNPKYTENNWGFRYFKKYSKDNNFTSEYYYVVNGEEYGPYYAQSVNLIEFFMTENNWAFMHFKEDEKMLVINGDTFGPYDDIRSFTISDEMWAFAYEKDSLFFVLASGMDPYQVPITSAQANSYDKGIFKSRGGFYNPKQCPFCFYPGFDEISLYKKTWGLRYQIDGEYKYFPVGENIRIITEYKMYDRLKGKILINVDRGGMAYYINPRGKVAHYLAKPKDAFEVMRKVGVGISENDYNLYKNRAPEKLAGTIILRVEAAGEAYYIDPGTLKMHYLGRPADAFKVMRELGLGISGADFERMTDLSK